MKKPGEGERRGKEAGRNREEEEEEMITIPENLPSGPRGEEMDRAVDC